MGMVIKVDLRDWTKSEEEGGPTAEEVRARMKERGVVPPRPWIERPILISCTGGVFEPYVPPEGDGRISVVSMPGAKQKLQLLEKKSKSMMAVRKIRSFDEDFEMRDFVIEAAEIYKKAHEYLVNNDRLNLREYVTERAYPLLAIYDRFGRLMYGSETIPKDVLEYVVFEKHLSNQYGKWRIHDKIIPDWMPPKPPAPITYVKKLPEPATETEPAEETKIVPKEKESEGPLATA
ncbi:hypothetical protein J437_LFUL005637 [Ladona fulva]|uniref:Large ribosomal subunit protein mL45 n=1 Tax=Ladona fulva TaxID=123851 RepID=A0A8K0NV80_LADFU|nr:hypothetical protein J437_LFUL005637 [Ladona fulva]